MGSYIEPSIGNITFSSLCEPPPSPSAGVAKIYGEGAGVFWH